MKTWRVTSSSLSHEGPDYVIDGSRLAETRVVNGSVLAAWPLQVAEKSWADIEDFIENFRPALIKFKPAGWERLDLEETFRVARLMSDRDKPGKIV